MQCASGRTYRGSELFLHYYVYTYSDPKNGQIRYVGKGNYFRAWSHLNESSNRELHSLIKKRQTEGFNVQPLILQLFPESQEGDAYELECKLINYHGRKDLGLGPLFNYTDGGSKDPGNVTANALEFRGEQYLNLSICAREYGVPITNVYRRIRLNWTLAQALEVDGKTDGVRPRPVTYKGLTYRSISNFAEEHGLRPDSVRQYLNRGLTPAQIVEGNTHTPRLGSEIICGDVVYPSIANFARSLTLSVKAVSYWLETGYSPEEIKRGEITNKAAVYTSWKGMALTQGAFADLCNITFTTLIKYRKKGLTNEEIFELGQRSLSSKLGGKPVELSELSFSTRQEFANHLGIPKTTLTKWLEEFRFSGETCLEAVKLANEIASQNDKSRKACLEHATRILRGSWPKLTLDGRIITKKDLIEVTGLHQQTINSRLAEGLTPEELIEWGKHNPAKSNFVEPFIVHGMRFTTYAAFARWLGFKNSSIVSKYRNKLNFSCEEIVDIAAKAKSLGQDDEISRQALSAASRAANRTRNGKSLMGKTAKYVELRRQGADPKTAAKEVGLSLSNTSRLEKTHAGIISGAENYRVL